MRSDAGEHRSGGSFPIWPAVRCGATMIAVASGARDNVSDLIPPRDFPGDTMAFGS
jgi:hypothetical protein